MRLKKLSLFLPRPRMASLILILILAFANGFLCLLIMFPLKLLIDYAKVTHVYYGVYA